MARPRDWLDANFSHTWTLSRTYIQNGKPMLRKSQVVQDNTSDLPFKYNILRLCQEWESDTRLRLHLGGVEGQRPSEATKAGLHLVHPAQVWPGFCQSHVGRSLDT